MGLIISGENAGRVVNLDMELHKPRVCYEDNFLDWYERCLDESISGILLADGPSWFGYTKGGGDGHLLVVFSDSSVDLAKLEPLNGLATLLSIRDESKEKLLGISSGDFPVAKRQRLAEFSYERAVSELEALIDGDNIDCTVCCQCIFWYAKHRSCDWIE